MADAIIPLTPAQTAAQELQAAHEGYALRLLVAADQFANVLMGGRPDETISTNAALLDRKHRILGELLSHILNGFQKDHGADAAAGDLERAQAEALRVQSSGIVT